MTDMGIFHTDCVIENVADRKRSAPVSRLLVDTGSEYTWIPASVLEGLGIAREKKDVSFVMANGQQVTRSVGFAVVRSDGFFTVDEVVFAQEGDLSLLGARSLGGFNARIDPHRKKLLAAGPLLAAATRAATNEMQVGQASLIDETEFVCALEELIQFRHDLGYLPEGKRDRPATRSVSDQARGILIRIERCLSLNRGGLIDGSDGLGGDATYADVFLATGRMLTRSKERAPALFDKHFIPELPASVPFGYAAGAGTKP
jgi:predicted aspartyl protease